MQNALVAAAFDEIAALMEVAGENPFKIRAYKRAAEAVSHLGEPVEDVAEAGRLKDIEGLGEATAAKTQEFLATGTMKMLYALRAKYPPGLLDLMRVPGLGPKKVAVLYKEQSITSLEDLKRALDDDSLQGVAGFGPKTIENLKLGLSRLATMTGRLPLGDAQVLARSLLTWAASADPKARWEIAGSLRRGREDVGNINLLARTDDATATLQAFTHSPFTLAAQDHTAESATIKARGGVAVHLQTVREGFGAAWFGATGSPSHIEGARARAQVLGLGLDQVLASAGENESAIYSALGVPFIVPEMREGHGEWKAAADNTLPQLVEAGDIQGDLHAHSTWSDGVASIEEMARAMQARGYKYFAVSDHSRALAMANGLDARRLREQAVEIARVQEQFPDLKILRAIECDILRDGSLDLDDDILHELDLVIASVHSAFNLSEAAQTERIVKAIQHPAVDLIAHPTGRILGSRPAYDVDVAALIAAARESNTALEINASERLDLSDEHARAARDAGVLLCINTDAHSTRMLENIGLGISTARRAWCEPKNILNTRSLDELLGWLRR
jgi:DNA polymerase (family 10)